MHGMEQLSHDPSEKDAAVDDSRAIRRQIDEASLCVGETG